MKLRYLGFDQQQNIRAYRFQSLETGEISVHFRVTVDLRLFLAHHIGIQEGPSLCARKLAADLLLTVAPEEHSLTDDDLLAYVTARSAAEASQKSHSRRYS